MCTTVPPLDFVTRAKGGPKTKVALMAGEDLVPLTGAFFLFFFPSLSQILNFSKKKNIDGIFLP